jgi:hypothetical protein
MACFGNWIAVSPNGHSLFVTNGSGFSKFFRFDSRILKLLFSPRGQCLYSITKDRIVSRMIITPDTLDPDLSFEPLLTIPSLTNFMHLVSYEKVLYLIQDATISIVRDGVITQTFSIDTPITAIACIPRDIAKHHEIVPSNALAPTVVIIGNELGEVCRFSFPNSLHVLSDLSRPFLSRSDPISQIYIDDRHLIVAGRFGTVANGALPYPITSLTVHADQLFFVSQGRLFCAPPKTPSAVRAAASFTERVATLDGVWLLAFSGALIRLGTQNSATIDPRPQFMEFALTQLCGISDDTSSFQRSIISSEAALGNLQLIRALKSGHRISQPAISIRPHLQSDGRVCVRLFVSIEPSHGYSCRGLSLCITIDNSSFATESITVPNIRTDHVKWEHDIKVVSPQPIVVGVAFVHGRESVIAGSEMFDLMDYSVVVEAVEVAVGTLGPVQAKFGKGAPFTIQCNLVGTIPSEVTKPRAMIAPFGEHWTMRIDGCNCTIAAGTEATARCALAAVLRRIVPAEGEIDARVGMEGVQRAAGTFLAAVEGGRGVPRTAIVRAAKDFHREVQTWIDSLLCR